MKLSRKLTQLQAREDRLVNSVYAAKKAFGKDMVLAARDFLAVTIRHTDDTLES